MATVIGKSSGYIQRRETEVVLSVFLGIVGLAAISMLMFELWPSIILTLPQTISLAVLFGIILLFFFLKTFFESQEVAVDKWASGHAGENEAEKYLRRFPDTYTVFRDVWLGGKGNIDFVVVGPNGVFVVEVKNHAGAIGFDGSVLTRNGRPVQEKNLLMQAMNQSFQLRDYLTKRVGYQMFVTPILVFTHQYAKVRFGLTPIKGVTVVRKESVQQAIVGTKGTLGSELTAKIVEALQETVTR